MTNDGPCPTVSACTADGVDACCSRRSSAPPASFGAGLAQLVEAIGALQRQWAPVLLQLDRAAKKAAQRLAPCLSAFEAAIRRPEGVRVLLGLTEWAASLASAPRYCAPYDRELARLGLAPLTADEQRDFMAVALVLDGRSRWRLGHRLPLAEVALVAGRPDITVAAVMDRAATRAAVGAWEASPGDLQSAAYLALRESILPSIARRLNRIPLAEARTRTRSLLTQLLQDAYLIASVKRSLGESLAVERRERKREAGWDAETEFQVERATHRAWLSRGGEGELDWDIEQALASFCRRPGATELDRKLVAARRRWSDVSIAEIARRIGAPVRTVQYRHRKLLEHARKELEI